MNTTSRPNRGFWADLAVMGLAVMLSVGTAWAQAGAQAPDAEAAATRQSEARLADTDTLLALTADGAALYAQDDVKLDALQYCSQAVALAEAGEFRLSIRAASKALHLADVQQDDNLQALARFTFAPEEVERLLRMPEEKPLPGTENRFL